jgi:hypothetical protein
MNAATVSGVRRPRHSADMVFSAVGLVAVVETWRRVMKGIFDPYRPELHYMRGPGPKWRAAHGHTGPVRSMPRRRSDGASVVADPSREGAKMQSPAGRRVQT